MKIGVPKEIKSDEYRVGLTPYSVKELVTKGHTVYIEHNAGDAIHFTDAAYQDAGAEVLTNAEAVYKHSDMIIKVKVPQPQEYPLLRADQILFTYLHLAPDPQQADALINSGCVAVAYETVTDSQGGLPLLSPMSQVAGRLSVQCGATCLEKKNGGSGLLLGGVPGVAAAQVVVIGGGVVGTNAIRMAMGMEARVTVIDMSLKRLQELDMQFGCRLNTVYSTRATIEKYVTEADLVIGAVLVPGKAAPKLVTKEMIHGMCRGSVVVDVAIDQGGCFETSHATTHHEPTYQVNGVVHYCVANMPGAVPRTATLALNNATLPFVLALAGKGWKQALKDDAHLRAGLNVCQGHITHLGVATDLGKRYKSADEMLV